VLLVFSHERERWIYEALETNLRNEIVRDAPAGLNVYTEYLDTMRFDDTAYHAQTVEYFRAKYAQRSISVVVPVSPIALDFVLQNRDDVFHGVPIVFASVNVARAREVARLPKVTGVAVIREVTSTVDLALAVHPDTRALFLPAGDSVQEHAWTETARLAMKKYDGRVAVEFLTGLSMGELEQRLAELPPHSLVLFAGLMYHDATGRYFLPEDIVRRISRVSNAPVYSTDDAELGLGIVGGSLYDMAPVGAAAGAMVRRLLAGEPLSSIPMQILNPNANAFDARQLARWGIDERRLPAGSVVRFRPPSLWRDYRRQVLAGVAIVIVQMLLIAGLVYERRARQRAEIDSRQNLALAADLDRRVTVSALTGSIAHELRQPLGSILYNTQAAERLVASDRATRDVLRDILTDIRMADIRASEIIERHRALMTAHAVELQSIDLHDVVRESVALVASDVRTRRVQLDVAPPVAACPVVGDPVLLQQVLVNLVVNAMDAMADTPPEYRRLTVRTTAGEETVEMTVRDAGTGLSSSLDGRLFEAFVTTKDSGLGIGLTIARAIVESHRGRLDARNNPEGGATFSVTLPKAVDAVL
jgi:signal transduction histidine kinase